LRKNSKRWGAKEKRKKKEKKERLKAGSESNKHNFNSANILANNDHNILNGHVGKKINGVIESPRQDNSLCRR
jgi:hypothetical protein